MVKIGKLNPLSFERGGRIQSGRPSVQIPKEGGNTLQERLTAIDNGDPSAISFKQASYGYSPNSGSLQSRLDAIGTRELRPRYDEKNLDYYG